MLFRVSPLALSRIVIWIKHVSRFTKNFIPSFEGNYEVFVKTYKVIIRKYVALI